MSTGSQALTTATASVNEDNPSKRQKLNDGSHLAAGCAHAADDTVDSERSFIQSLVGVSEYSDVTVYVGRDEKEFKLHRIIICEKSPFFKAACKEHFKEGSSRQIKLPEILPEPFKEIVSWLYGGNYEISHGFNIRMIVATFKAADFLAMPALKKDILVALVTYARKKHKVYTKGGGFLNIPDIATLVNCLAEVCPASDYNTLKSAFITLCPVLVVSAARKAEVFSENLIPLNKLACTVALDSFSTLLSNNFCMKCRQGLELEPAKACKCCKGALRGR